MSGRRRSSGLRALRQAFDEARFGHARTLNLRESQPTVAEAVARVELWLRERQAAPGPSGDMEVLIITGRGNASAGGVSVVRSAVEGLLHRLRQRGVVRGHREHTPGSFVVELAPLRALLEARHPDRAPEAPRAPDPPSLDALDAETRRLLRALAERALDQLGVRDRDRFVADEMLKQFGAIARSLPSGTPSDAALRAAIRTALEQLD